MLSTTILCLIIGNPLMDHPFVERGAPFQGSAARGGQIEHAVDSLSCTRIPAELTMYLMCIVGISRSFGLFIFGEMGRRQMANRPTSGATFDDHDSAVEIRIDAADWLV